MKKIVIILILSILLSSCSSENSQVLTEEESEWDKQVVQFGEKYLAYMNWEDELEDALTIEIQKDLNRKTVLFKDYSLEDVYREGSSFVAKFDGYDGMFLVLKTNDQNLIDRLVVSHEGYGYYTLVAEIKNISVPTLSLFSGTDGEYSQIELSSDTYTYIEGRLVAFITSS